MDKYGKAVIEGAIELALSGEHQVFHLDAVVELKGNFFRETRRCAYKGRKILALRAIDGSETYCWLEPNDNFHAESSWDEAFDEVDAEIHTMKIDAKIARVRSRGRRVSRASKAPSENTRGPQEGEFSHLPEVDSGAFRARDYS